MLELTIIEGLSPDNPTEKKKRFNDRGGMIGRDLQADWILFDPERIISSHHAKVIFSQGAYYLSDLSVNGVSTEQGQKLRKGEYRPIGMGDIYVIGPYRIEVTALNTADATLPFKEAGLGHILTEPGTQEGLSPLDYVQKQNHPFTEKAPFADFPPTAKPDTLKAFDFMPEPIDFRLNPCIPKDDFLQELKTTTEKANTAAEEQHFIPQFCKLFNLEPQYFNGLDDAHFAKSMRALLNAFAASFNRSNML